MLYVRNVFSGIFFGLFALFAIACTVDIPPADVQVVDGTSDLSVSMQLTSVDILALNLGDATEHVIQSDTTPKDYRIDSWHLTLTQRFHVDGTLPTAVWLRAEDDGGLPIGGAPIDDRYGQFYPSVGGDAEPLTNGEHWPSELAVMFRLFTVDMSAGHPIDPATGEEVDPLGTLYYLAKPGLPLSAISQSSPGDVTMEVLLEPPPIVDHVDPSP